MSFKKISIDIVSYLQNKQNLSIEDIAKTTKSSPKHIQDIVDKKSSFTKEEIDSYIKSLNTPFWKFMYEAVPMEHLPEKTRHNILFCKEMSEIINKKRR